MKTLGLYFLLFLQLCTMALASPEPSNVFTFGDGTNTTKKLKAKIGSGASDPVVQYNSSTSKWQHCVAGVCKDMGTGSGGSGGGVNLLTGDDNAGFEDGLTAWTASGGSFSIDSSTPLFGLKSALFDASALNQTLSATPRTVPVGLQGQNCLAILSYQFSGTTGDYKIQAYDGSTVLGEQSLEPTTGTDVGLGYVGFPCPATGTIVPRVIAGVSNPAVIKLDGSPQGAGLVHIGSNILLAQVANAELVGTLKIAPDPACAYQSVATGWQDFPVDSDCPAPTVTGKLSAAATNVPGFKIANIPAGEYMVYAHAITLDASSLACSFAISDGTTRSGKFYGQPSTAAYQHLIVGHFSYATAQTNVTFQIQSNAPTSTLGDCRVTNANGVASTDPEIEFTVVKLPTMTQTIISGIEGSAKAWSGYHDNDCLFSVTSVTYANYTPDSTCTFTERVNKGFGSVTSYLSGSDKLPGILWAANSLGDYEVKANIAGEGAIGQALSYSLEDASGNTIAECGRESNGYRTNIACSGLYRVTAIGAQTIRIRGKSTSGANDIVAAPSTGKPIEWSIFKVDQQFPMPTLVDSTATTCTTLGISATTTPPTKGASPVIDRVCYHKTGPKLCMEANFQNGGAGNAAGSGTYLFTIPGGYVINSAKTYVDALIGGHVGSAHVLSTGTNYRTGFVYAYDSTHLALIAGDSSTPPELVSSSAVSLSGSDIAYGYEACVYVQ